MFSVVILNHIKLYLENKMNNINFGQNAYDLSISESQYFDITLVLSVFNKKHKIKLNKFDCLGELINHLKLVISLFNKY